MENQEEGHMRNTRWTMWVLVILGAAAAANAQDKWMVLANPDNTFAFSIMRGDEMVAGVGFTGWGPGWKWVGINPKTGPKGDEYIVNTPFVIDRAAGQVVNIQLHAAQKNERSVTLTYELSAEKEVGVTELVATIGIARSMEGRLVADVDGKPTNFKLPLGARGSSRCRRPNFSFRTAARLRWRSIRRAGCTSMETCACCWPRAARRPGRRRWRSR